jgi:hypothetical protein
VSARVNSPWKSFLLFLLVGGIAWAGYEFLYVRKILTGSSRGEMLSQDQHNSIHERIVSMYSNDPCFGGVLGNSSWRVRDDYSRIEITVADGCEDRAKSICHEIADMIDDEYKVRCSVWAFDSGSRQVANHVN